MNGFIGPDKRTDLSDEELEWLTFLRMISGGRVSSPTLRAVQALRTALGKVPPAQSPVRHNSVGMLPG